jgi:hypothetical protein
VGSIVILLHTLTLPCGRTLRNSLGEKGHEFANRALLVEGKGRQVVGIAQDRRRARVGSQDDGNGVDLHCRRQVVVFILSIQIWPSVETFDCDNDHNHLALGGVYPLVYLTIYLVSCPLISLSCGDTERSALDLGWIDE